MEPTHGLSKNSAIWSVKVTGQVMEVFWCRMADSVILLTVNNLAVALDDGRCVYSVEVFYDYSPIFSRVFDEEYLIPERHNIYRGVKNG